MDMSELMMRARFNPRTDEQIAKEKDKYADCLEAVLPFPYEQLSSRSTLRFEDLINGERIGILDKFQKDELNHLLAAYRSQIEIAKEFTNVTDKIDTNRFKLNPFHVDKYLYQRNRRLVEIISKYNDNFVECPKYMEMNNALYIRYDYLDRKFFVHFDTVSLKETMEINAITIPKELKRSSHRMFTIFDMSIKSPNNQAANHAYLDILEEMIRLNPGIKIPVMFNDNTFNIKFKSYRLADMLKEGYPELVSNLCEYIRRVSHKPNEDMYYYVRPDRNGRGIYLMRDTEKSPRTKERDESHE